MLQNRAGLDAPRLQDLSRKRPLHEQNANQQVFRFDVAVAESLSRLPSEVQSVSAFGRQGNFHGYRDPLFSDNPFLDFGANVYCDVALSEKALRQLAVFA